MTPLALAADLSNLHLCEQLLDAGADVNLSIYDRLPQFFLDDYGDQMKDLVDTMSMEYLKDLHWTEVDRTTSLADYLCDNDEYYEAPICFSTALEYAIRAKSTAVVELLLKWGVNLSVRYTTSPLILALLQGQGECVELLLDYGASPREVGGHRLRIDALQAASMTGPMCIAERLVQAGADINSPTHGVQGLTTLQWAAVRGDLNLLKYLLSHGAEVNAPAATEYGYTALQAAVLVGHEQVVNLLLDWGAEVNSSPSKVAGFTALAAAIYVGNEYLFWKLIKIGADVNLVEWEDCDNLNNHLLLAAEADTTSFVQWLLALGVDFDMRLRSGYTLGEMALLQAVKAHRRTTVHLLLGRNSILSSDILT
jgi:ankyrin repeat protein